MSVETLTEMIQLMEVLKISKALLRQQYSWYLSAAAAAAKSLQSCPTLCDPTDGSPPGSSTLFRLPESIQPQHRQSNEPETGI